MSGVYRNALQNILDNLSEENKLIIYGFLEDSCVKKGFTEKRRLKYLRIIRKSLEIMGSVNLSNLNKETVDKYFFWVSTNQTLSDDTKKDYWQMFRIFTEYINPNLGIRQYRLRVKLKRKLPEDILSEEEVNKLIDSAQSVRTKALLSLLYHGSMRPSELTGLRIRDLTFDQYGAVVMVRDTGKTGSRRLRIIEPVSLLAQYLQEHRYREDHDAPLFYREDRYSKTHLYSTSVNNIVKECAKRAQIRKRVYSYILRHSKLTHLSKQLNSQEVMIYAGHKKLTTTQVYVHLSGADIEEKILKIHGIKQDNTSTDILKSKNCLRCSSTNDSSSKYCAKCGMVLDQKEAFDLKDVDDKEFKGFMMEMFMKWKTLK
ncbi:MAG: tyrosine-type recombinase/integrase [Candidatus Aenigmarchaeota archaeon]|nr:tyrosine-type recombinase/integrase [Candidatus Aenigmarchaeota archaeon]